MQVIVVENNIERAIIQLRRKMSHEGIFSDMRKRVAYDKPGVRKRAKQRNNANRIEKARKKKGKLFKKRRVPFLNIFKKGTDSQIFFGV